MYAARYNMKLVKSLKDLIFAIHYGESLGEKTKTFSQQFEAIPSSEILLMVHELRYSNHGFTTGDVEQFFKLYEEVFRENPIAIKDGLEDWHPVTVFKSENLALSQALTSLKDILEGVESLDGPLTDQEIMEELQNRTKEFGQFISHYHRKEKLFFPILERYGQFSMTRIMWGEDDRNRNFYKSAKSMVERLASLDFLYIKQTFDHLFESIEEMIFQEETFLLPIVLAIFKEEEWLSIHEESGAYGYAFIDPVQGPHTENRHPLIDEELAKMQIPFGGGYLTLKEADMILNNLPVEITFVDKFGVFKYFNDMVESSEMMFIRTPSSIGRNVGNCHPPSSMKKVATLIRDLQLRHREYECMWFKKDGRYVHITYKGLFDEEGEYLGILEYVQDINPFLQLPREVKKELQPLS